MGLVPEAVERLEDVGQGGPAAHVRGGAVGHLRHRARSGRGRARSARRCTSSVVGRLMRTVYLGTSDFAATVLDRLAVSAAPAGAGRHAARTRRAGAGRKVAPPPVAERAGAARHRAVPAGERERRGGARAHRRRASPRRFSSAPTARSIKEPLLSEHEMLNVHPSLLPRWRGAAPIERAIEAGDEETGVTIMRPDRGARRRARSPFSGPRPIDPDDDYGSLSDRLAALGGELLVEALDTEPPFRDQPDTGVTYAEKIGPEDRLLDPELTRRPARAPGARAPAARRRLHRAALGRAARRRPRRAGRRGGAASSGRAGRARRPPALRRDGRRARALRGASGRASGPMDAEAWIRGYGARLAGSR